MAFLEQDAKPISAGWGPEPKLEAGNIGTTLAAILTNRRVQQQQTQEALTAAIKAQQDRNQNAAYAQALQNAGLTSGQDISGLSGAQATAFAKAIQDQQQTSQDKYYDAMTAWINKDKPLAGGGRSGGRGGSMVTVTDENGDPVMDASGNPLQVPAGSRLGQQIAADQGNITTPPSASVASAIAAKMNLPPQSITDTAQHQGMGLVPGSGVDAQGKPYETKYMPVSPGDEPTDIKVSPTGTDPKTQQPYQPVIVQRDTLEQLRRALQGRSYRPQPKLQPDPDINNQTPLPQAAPSSPPAARPSTSSGRPDASTGAPINLPKAGDVVAGYRFQGGDPNDRNNWVQVN
jgi:hypothetical protein